MVDHTIEPVGNQSGPVGSREDQGETGSLREPYIGRSLTVCCGSTRRRRLNNDVTAQSGPSAGKTHK